MPTFKINPEEKEDHIAQLKSAVLSYYPITDSSFELLKGLVEFQALPKDEMLLGEGKTARHIHFIVKGALRTYIVDEAGNVYTKNLFMEGDFAGSKVSLLLQKPSSFNLQALEDCILINLDFKRYRALIDTHNDLKNFYIAYLEKNWVIGKEQREISLVMENATDRYLALLKKHPDMAGRIPLQHIASHLGITPTQLSRIRKDLKIKG